MISAAMIMGVFSCNTELTQDQMMTVLDTTSKEKVYEEVLKGKSAAELLEKLSEEKKAEILTILLTDAEKERIFNELLADKRTAKTFLALLDATDTAAPDKVTDFAAENLDGAVRLTWTDATNEDILAYEITYAIKNESRAISFEANIVIIPQGVGKAIIGDLTNGNTYTFTIKTVDKIGNKSEGQSVECLVMVLQPVIITYVSKYGTLPESKVVPKGHKLTAEDLPELTTEFGTFLGWDKNIGEYIFFDTTITASREIERATLAAANSWFKATAAGKTEADITKITFQEEAYTDASSASWEANVSGGNPVTAYLVNDTEIIVSGNGRVIKAKESCYMMFNYFTNVEKIVFNSFDTSNVTDMSHMFEDCSSLTELDISGFDTSNVKYMSYMFNNCSLLTTIYVSDKFVIAASTSTAYMFSNCSKLTGGAGTVYNSSRVDKTYARIDGGEEKPGYFTAKTE